MLRNAVLGILGLLGAMALAGCPWLSPTPQPIPAPIPKPMPIVPPPTVPPPSGSFVDRMSARIDALVAHDRVRVEVAHFAPGTDPALLQDLERERGLPLPADIRAFYLEVGRVQLMWRCLPPGESNHDRPDPKVPSTDPFPSGQDFDGIIDLFGALEVFRTGSYKDDLWFPNVPELKYHQVDGRQVEREHLRRFDLSDHYSQVALLVEPGKPEIRAVIGGDYFAEVGTDSLRFGRYLDMLVDNLGYGGGAGAELCKEVASELGIPGIYSGKAPLYRSYL